MRQNTSSSTHSKFNRGTEKVTQRAIALMESLTLSHGLQMGDALIAATSLQHQMPLLTGNVKHFVAIEHLLIEGFSI